jgi:outer membrane immunogenic protein
VKKTSLALAALMCADVVSAVRAADVFTYPNPGTASPGGPPQGPQFISPPMAPFWGGAYVGLNLGGGLENVSWANSLGGPANRTSPLGVIGGGEVGYNYQFYAWVVGIEGAVTGMDLSGSGNDAVGFTYRIQTYWTATVAGRLGYEYEKRLVYVRGGIAFADSRETVTDPNGNSATGTVSPGVGWTVGVGVEFPLTMSWSARVEYDYLDFHFHSFNLNLPQFGTVTTSSTLGIQTVSAGINYRF